MFNGKDLTGWTLFNYSQRTQENGKSFWAFDPKSGVLSASELEKQDLITVAKYSDFVLKLEWRYTPGGQVRPNGAGIMVRSNGLKTQKGGDPRGIEIDLRPETDIERQWGPGGFIAYETGLTNHKRKADGLLVRNLATIRRHTIKAGGQWNECEISCEGHRIKVWMDGVLVNEGWDCSAASGHIVLRSDLTDVDFRNIKIKEGKKE